MKSRRTAWWSSTTVKSRETKCMWYVSNSLIESSWYYKSCQLYTFNHLMRLTESHLRWSRRQPPLQENVNHIKNLLDDRLIPSADLILHRKLNCNLFDYYSKKGSRGWKMNKSHCTTNTFLPCSFVHNSIKFLKLSQSFHTHSDSFLSSKIRNIIRNQLLYLKVPCQLMGMGNNRY